MTLNAHPTMTQIEAINAEIDRQLVTYKDRHAISNTEFVNALLDVRIVADAFWCVAIPDDAADAYSLLQELRKP